MRHVLLPVGGKGAVGAVEASKAVDARLDENQAVLAVSVLALLLKMLADIDGLLDEVVEILGELGGKAVGLEDADNLAAGDRADLGNTWTGPKRTLLGFLTEKKKFFLFKYPASHGG